MLYPDACDALLQLVALRAPPLCGGRRLLRLLGACLGCRLGGTKEEPVLEELALRRSRNMVLNLSTLVELLAS